MCSDFMSISFRFSTQALWTESPVDRVAWRRSRRVARRRAPSLAQTADDPAPRSRRAPRRGRIHRMFHHVAHTVQDKFVGYPDTFVEPPLGYYVNEQLAVQVAKANTHRFTFYRSDFLPGTSQFSPAGASRFNVMAARIPGWMGPIMVEWTPDSPALAEAAARWPCSRRCKRPACPLVADRVVIGPSPYPGAMGVEAVHTYREHDPAERWRGSRCSRCRRPKPPPREFTEMPIAPDSRLERSGPACSEGGARGRSSWRSRFAGWAALGSGCVVTPRQPPSATPTSPPQIPEGRRTPKLPPRFSSRGRRRTFTPRRRTGRRSRCISISDASSSRKATSTRPCSNIRKPSRSSRPSGGAHSGRRIRRWRTGAWRAPSIVWGDSPRPKVHYQKALKLSPKDPKVWNDVGYSYYLQGRWPDAERALKTAAKLAPDDERIRINLGLTLAAAGKTTEALPASLACSRRCQRAMPTWATCWPPPVSSTWLDSNTRPRSRSGPTWNWHVERSPGSTGSSTARAWTTGPKRCWPPSPAQPRIRSIVRVKPAATSSNKIPPPAHVERSARFVSGRCVARTRANASWLNRSGGSFKATAAGNLSIFVRYRRRWPGPSLTLLRDRCSLAAPALLSAS